MAKNRHPRQSAGVWTQLVALRPQRGTKPAPVPDTQAPARRKRYVECAERNCQVRTAYGRCSAHTVHEKRGIRERVLQEAAA